MSVRFDAATDAYTAATGLPSSTSWTVTFWVMLRGSGSTPNGHHKFCTLISDTSGLLVIGTAFGDTVAEVYNGAETLGGGFGALALDAWYRVGYVQSGASGTLYIGTESGSLSSFNDASFNGTNPADDLYIGASHEAEWLNGRLAAFKLWSAARTQAEVEAELAQFDPVISTNLLRYHKLKVPETTDYSGNGNTLTAGSTATTTEADPPIPDVVSTGVLRLPIRVIQIP